jgi:hypothetical protein
MEESKKQIIKRIAEINEEISKIRDTLLLEMRDTPEYKGMITELRILLRKLKELNTK